MNRLFISLFLLFPFIGQSQTYFNKLYDFGAPAYGLSVLETPTGYLLTGGASNSSGIQTLRYLFVDGTGREQIKKEYVIPKFAVAEGKAIQLKDGNYLDWRTLSWISSGDQIACAWLIKFNEQGDTLWSKCYSDKVSKIFVSKTLIETTDSGFVLVADKQVSVSNNNPVLIRTDKNGKELYRKEIKTNKTEKIFSADNYPTSGYVFGGGGKSNGSINFSSWVIKTNDSLNVIWERYGNFQSSFYSKASVLSDSTIINTTDSVFSNGDWSYKRITKLDSNGKVIWANNHENGKQFAYYNKAVELDDKSLVAYGEHNVGSSSLRALTKLTPNGDTIWSNLYYYDSPDDQNYLRDFIATKDGGFLMGGNVSPHSTGTGSDLWLLKVDSNGCSSPSCTSRVYDIRLGIDYRQEANTNFKVFPNPVKDKLYVEQIGETNESTNWSFRLLNANGQEIQMGNFTNGKTLNTLDLPSGVYLLKLENGPIQKVYRVVKE